MSDINTSIIVDLEGNLQNRAQRFSSSIDSMSKKGRRSLGLLRKSTIAVGRGLDRMGNRYTSILGGAASVAAVKGVKDLQTQLTRLQTDAGLSDEKMQAIKQSLFDLATDPNVRVAPQQILAAFGEIVSRTGDIKFAEENLKNIGLTMQGFGSDALSTGALMAQFWEKGVRAPDDVLATNDKLFSQFTKGSISVKEIARVAPQLFSQIQNQGPEAIAQMGALLQLFAKTTGSADVATTSIAAMIRTFSDGEKVKMFEENGIQIYKEGSVTDLNNINVILRDIIEKAKSNPLILKKVFASEEAIKGINSLLKSENRDLLDDMIDGQVELGKTSASAAKNAATMDAALTSIGGNVERFANARLAGPIAYFADALNSLDPDQIQQYFDYAVAGATALGVAIVAMKVDRATGVSKLLGRAVAGKKAGALGAVSATPVWVVNMPGGGGLPGEIVGGKGKPGSRRPGRFGLLKSVKNLSSIPALGLGATSLATGSVFAAGAGGYAVGTGINAGINSIDRNFDTRIGNSIGKAVAHVLAAFGNSEAKQSIETNKKLGEVSLVVESAPGLKVSARRVRGYQSDIEVDTGRVMAGG